MQTQSQVAKVYAIGVDLKPQTRMDTGESEIPVFIMGVMKGVSPTMAEEQQASEVLDRDPYSKRYREVMGDGPHTKPTTIEIADIKGKVETFVIQTSRFRDQGDYVFLKYIDEQRSVTRIALPPQVTKAIARQSASLTKKRRSLSAKERMKQMMAAGYVPHFVTHPPKRKPKKKQ